MKLFNLQKIKDVFNLNLIRTNLVHARMNNFFLVYQKNIKRKRNSKTDMGDNITTSRYT